MPVEVLQVKLLADVQYGLRRSLARTMQVSDVVADDWRTNDSLPAAMVAVC